MSLSQNGLRRWIWISRGSSVRNYSLTCPPRTPPGECGCGGRKPAPPHECRPTKIAPNPCCPVFHHGEGTWKKYKFIALFFCLPVIFAHSLNCLLGHCPPPKGECREYEYMRRRTKRYWFGDGRKTLFHNDHVNHLPGDCTPAPLDCD